MTGDHVGEESDGQRGRLDDDHLQQLDGRQNDVERPRHSSREELRLEIAPDALLTESRDHILAESPDGKNQGHGDGGRGRDVHAWYDAAEVEDQDGQEDGRDHGHVALAPNLAQGVIDDRVADELDDPLDGPLPAGGDQLGPCSSDSQHQKDDDHGYEPDQDDPVHGEGRSLEKNLRRQEIFDGG